MVFSYLFIAYIPSTLAVYLINRIVTLSFWFDSLAGTTLKVIWVVGIRGVMNGYDTICILSSLCSN